MQEIIIKKVEEKARQTWTTALNVIQQAAIDEARKLGLSDSGAKIFINALANANNVCPDAVKESVVNDILKAMELDLTHGIAETVAADVSDEDDRENFLRDEIFRITGKKPGGNSKLETLEKTYADLLETANGGDDG